VISALVNLGYQRAAAEKALLVARTGKSSQNFDVLFREALDRSRSDSALGHPRWVIVASSAARAEGLPRTNSTAGGLLCAERFNLPW